MDVTNNQLTRSMKKKLIIPVAIVLLMSGLFAVARNYHWFGINERGIADLPGAKDELRKLYSRYGNPAATFTIAGTMRLFDKEDDNKLKEQMSFGYSKQGLQCYMWMGSQQTYMTDKLVLQLDTVHKYIVISPISTDATPLSASGVLPFEKYMEDTSAFKIKAVVSEKNKERSIEIISELDPEVKLSTIYYDPGTYAIRRAEIEWWKEPMIEDSKEGRKKVWLTTIEYNYPASAQVPVAERVKNIVVEKNGKYEPVPRFSDYQVQSSF